MRLGIFVPIFLAFQAISSFADNESLFIVEIEADNVYERSMISEIIHIDSVMVDRVFAVVNNYDLLALAKHGGARIVSAEMLLDGTKLSSYYDPFLNVVDFPDQDAEFHNYDEMVLALRSLETEHSALVNMFSIGKSIQGQDIWALKITDNSESTALDQNKKAIAYMATHHAREHVSTEMPIMFAEKILELSLTDPDIQSLLKQIEIYIIPIVNPDGASHDIEGKKYKWWRKNRRKNHDGSFGVDLNRNYGYGWGTGGSSSNPRSEVYMGQAPFSEPETEAIKDFFTANQNITIALSFHTFSELVLYPWGGKEEGVGGQDEAIFKKMAEDIVKMNKYTPMQSSELYIASGDTCDWLYGELSVYCLTFELSPSSMNGGGFYPGASIIEDVFNDNLEPMLYLANLAENPRLALE